MLAVSLATLLSLAVPTWVAFAITAAVFGIGGAMFLSRGRNLFRAIEVKPNVTLHNLEEDQRWTKGLTQNVRSSLRQGT